MNTDLTRRPKALAFFFLNSDCFWQFLGILVKIARRDKLHHPYVGPKNAFSQNVDLTLQDKLDLKILF